MHVGVTMPTRNRVEKIERLLDSLGDLGSHVLTFTLGLDGDDPQHGMYRELFERRETASMKFCSMDLPKWQGLACAFNYLIPRMPEGPETFTMFGDDMVFENNAEAVFDVVEKTLATWKPDKIGGIVFNDRSWNFDQRGVDRWGGPVAVNGFFHRSWFEALGEFYPGAFWGDYGDLWLTRVCQSVGRYHVERDLAIPHLHATFDAAYKDVTATTKKAKERASRYNGKAVWAKHEGKVAGEAERLKKFMRRGP